MNGSAVFGEDESSPDRVTRWKTQLPTVRDPDDSSIDMEEGVVIKDYANDKYGAPERETGGLSHDSPDEMFVHSSWLLLQCVTLTNNNNSNVLLSGVERLSSASVRRFSHCSLDGWLHILGLRDLRPA